jgi:dTDP-4-dehydrorhamnose reductase
MKILLLGKDGQVGWELQRALAPLGEVLAYGRDGADLADAGALRALVAHTAPDVIVNAAAYTAVDKAETDQDAARAVNAAGVGVLAREAARLGAWLVHYSTDYVFDGAKPAAYLEDDVVAPQSVYGASKEAGEQAIRASGCRHLILRTSWVFAARGGNFAKTMLRLAQERDQMKVVGDQYGAPTSAELIADVTALCLYRLAHDAALAKTASGTYHLAAGGETTWHGYAQFVVGQAARLGVQVKVAAECIQAIATSEYPVPAKRPANSRLDTQKLRQTFGLALPDWQVHVARLVSEIVI